MSVSTMAPPTAPSNLLRLARYVYGTRYTRLSCALHCPSNVHQMCRWDSDSGLQQLGAEHCLVCLRVNAVAFLSPLTSSDTYLLITADADKTSRTLIYAKEAKAISSRCHLLAH